MNKHIKRLAITAVASFTLLGLSATIAMASGYIIWGGTADYHQTSVNLEGINVGIGNLKTDKQNLTVERDNLMAEYQRLQSDSNNTGRENERLNNTIKDLNNSINALEQQIVALEKQASNGRTTQDMLGQAEKDMKHVKDQSKEILDGLNQ